VDMGIHGYINGYIHVRYEWIKSPPTPPTVIGGP